MEKVIILGSGNAGYTAAIYAARAELQPVLLTGFELGGQLTLTTEVENFPGFPEGIMGPKLMENMQKQAERFGTRIEMDKANSFQPIKGGYEIGTESGKTWQTKSIIICTGASARWLGLDSEKKFQGRGIHTCATCDGFFYKGKEVIVVGGGDSACEEASFLAKHANKVYVVHRRDQLRASKVMQKRILDNPKIEIIWNTQITAYRGDEKLLSVTLYDNKEKKERDFPIAGVFLALGHIPNTSMFKEHVKMDDHGFILTDASLKTNLPGIFAAGDVQDTRYKQAVTAAGSGCQAALEAERYLEE